ncbi:MAG: AraC family transcriptional regulator [Akkermansiaceae bacterium]|jgi:AraC-like DNA-binding protein|nr:AraC family transcriptional regulator [Akkermansiaceae bacterium]MDP4647350.1 AraC family transcriptional regulator [Akkermansiaceae bacterium]MDP4720137.1 AraC family transcriptional regulator [Akkermansiaceae bacterium]MDP4779502.1 AraC family transcriptional regulator [Akkermansiaceae bacterium]MDP4847320.1 AraC family transcriptional regulator [Akkermansiaceae bacterium]
MDEAADSYEEDRENFGKETRWQAIRADKSDDRSWLRDTPVCPLLQNHLIAHVGLMWAKAPFKVIRSEASGTFALIGLEGEGETLIDGQWHTLVENEICLLPAFAPTAIRAKNDHLWSFAWVRYEEARETSPILSSNSPVVQKGNVLPLKHAIAGLSGELINNIEQPAALHHWVELIHGFVARAASPFQDDDRLWRVWQAVEKDLAHDWTLTDMESIAHLSQEHLRRLCQQQLGRSPIQQITYLRMRHAVSLLTTTEDKIDTIAKAVGYQSPFTFSNAFKRWTGKRPTHFRD